MRIVQLYPLHHGKVTLVDDPDFERVSQFRWTASLRLRANGDELTWYALRNYRSGGQQHCVLLHRFLKQNLANWR